MGDEQHGAAVLLPQLQQPALHVAARQRIQRAERLVEQHQLLRRQQGAQEGGPLLHAAGQHVRISTLEAAQPDLVQPAAGVLPCGGLRLALQLPGEQDVVQGAAPGEERGLLRHVADLAALPGHGMAVHADCSGIRRLKAADDVEQGAFAAAGRAKDGDELLRLDRQGDLVQYAGLLVAASERLGDAADFERRRQALSGRARRSSCRNWRASSSCRSRRTSVAGSSYRC
ncbi:hypothetical protein D3C75_437140 [compost metagenome]